MFQVGDRVQANISVLQTDNSIRVYENRTGKVVSTLPPPLVMVQLDVPIDSGTEYEMRTVYTRVENCSICL